MKDALQAILIFVTLHLLFGSLSAQPGNISLIHYTTDDGLSHDEVNCIFKDRDGFMWFGTASGLNRFDGREFKVYLNEPDNPHSLPNNNVIGITEDSSGMLWISTHGGLARFDKYKQTFETLDLPEQRDSMLSNEWTSRLIIDKKGYGWFASYAHLQRLNLKTRQVERFPTPVVSTNPGHVFVDRKGRIWVNIQTALYQFNTKNKNLNYVFGNVKGVRPGVDVGELFEEADGTLWCGSWNLGLYRYNESSNTFDDFPDGPRISVQIFPDKDENGNRFFWTSGGLDGLFLYYPDKGEEYRLSPNPRNPYSHNGFLVKDFYKDSIANIIWIATEYGGLEKYDPNTIKFRRNLIPIGKGFNQFSFVSCVLRDKLDPTGEHYWVGMWGTGLLEWNRRTNAFRSIARKPNNALNSEVFDLAQAKDGKLYVANALGMSIYDPKTGQAQFLNDFMKYPFVWNKALSVTIDHAGQVWIGANYDGLFRYDPQTEKMHRVPFYDTSEIKKTVGYVTAIQEDTQHRLWIATHSGVFRLNPTTGESRFIHGGKLPNIYRSDGLYIGKKGNVWVATVEGLVQLDTSGRFIRRYGAEDGLQSEHIFDVLEDRHGMVWLATTNKLHRLNPKTHEILPFDKSNGLFNNGLTDGFNLTDQGEIFIGFQNAFNYFDPSKVPFNRNPPGIVLTGLKILNKERGFSRDPLIRLDPNENVVSLEFAALNYSQSNKNQYAYQLEGFDQDWNFTDQPIATYTNLDGGEYTLWVKAANNDGIWSAPVELARLEVIPPFYRTLYFVILLVLIGMAITAGFLRYRWQQRLRLQEVRDRIARDLHDDVGSTLSSIRFFSEFARSKVVNPEVTPILQRISESAATLSESMQDIIWAINSKNDQLNDLVTRMREFGLRTLEARNISFKVIISEGFLSAYLNIGQRRNIYLIFKEAINNAAKYAQCSEVQLHLKLVKNHLEMIIIDNGVGFNTTKATSGNGLFNMKKRATEIKGVLQICSEIGAGTTISLKVNL